MKKISKIIAIGIVQNENGEILLSRRLDPKIKDAHLKWDVPGGSNEFGEALEDTVAREVLEETGLEVEVLEMFPKGVQMIWQHDDYEQHTLVFCYSCRHLNGDLQLDDHKIDKLKWIKVRDVLDFDLLPATREFIELGIKMKFFK